METCVKCNRAYNKRLFFSDNKETEAITVIADPYGKRLPVCPTCWDAMEAHTGRVTRENNTFIRVVHELAFPYRLVR